MQHKGCNSVCFSLSVGSAVVIFHVCPVVSGISEVGNNGISACIVGWIVKRTRANASQWVLKIVENLCCCCCHTACNDVSFLGIGQQFVVWRLLSPEGCNHRWYLCFILIRVWFGDTELLIVLYCIGNDLVDCF